MPRKQSLVEDLVDIGRAHPESAGAIAIGLVILAPFVLVLGLRLPASTRLIVIFSC